jgi:radical SAM protein with 4Fe4S-binding SPASM domain
MISFFLTTKCNLSCIYCYNKEERKKLQEISLPLEIAQAGIDFYFQSQKSRHIRFYGPGEPTQVFQLMKSITEYAKQKDDTATTEIQTNGVFGKNIRRWVLDNINIVWISFDGLPDIQDFNRPISGKFPSSPIIEENIKWIIENKENREIMVGVRVTMTDKNIFRQEEMIDYFFHLGIRHVWTDPLFPGVGKIPVYQDEEKLLDYSFNMDEYVKNYINAFSYARNKGMFYGSFLTCNFDGETNIHCRACTPAPHLTPDGYVSACDLVLLGQESYHMDNFVYGKWNENKKRFDFDNEKILALQNRNTTNMDHCNNCRAKNSCGGYCLGEVTNETGSMYGQKPITCKAIQHLYDVLGNSSTPYPFLHP